MAESTPIRVLHVVPTLARGGAERQLVNVVTHTDRSRFEHTVCYFRSPDAFAEEIRRAGHRVVELGVTGKRPWFSAARSLIPLLRSAQPDVVQCWLYDANIGARLARLVVQGIPLVTCLQAPDYEPATIHAANWPRMKVEVLRWQDKISARWSRPTFVACSRFVARSAQRWLGISARQLRVIYNSVDPGTLGCHPDSRQDLRRSLDIPPESIVFMNVGRLDPQKGQAGLLRAFRRVLAEAPHSYLTITGGGPLLGELSRLAEELGISERVRFLGIRSDIGACLDMADSFVFPSLFEGFPVALIEAMCRALPCIASRIEPISELITDGNTGVMVAPGSVEELAEAMLALQRDAERRRKLGVNGQQRVLERYQSRVTMPQWEDLYLELVPTVTGPSARGSSPLRRRKE